MTSSLQIRPLQLTELHDFWQLAFSDPHAEWTKWNGPYFHDQLPDEQTFVQDIGPREWLDNPYRWVIEYDHQLVGALSAYFVDGDSKRWLEVGITIYPTNLWGHHLGSRALTLWINHLFQEVTSLPHIGLTTWSGNQRMLAVSDHIGLKLEGRIRQVRYWQGQYYDSMKYGILRDEWQQLHGEHND